MHMIILGFVVRGGVGAASQFRLSGYSEAHNKMIWTMSFANEKQEGSPATGEFALQSRLSTKPSGQEFEFFEQVFFHRHRSAYCCSTLMRT